MSPPEVMPASQAEGPTALLSGFGSTLSGHGEL